MGSEVHHPRKFTEKWLPGGRPVAEQLSTYKRPAPDPSLHVHWNVVGPQPHQRPRMIDPQVELVGYADDAG